MCVVLFRWSWAIMMIVAASAVGACSSFQTNLQDTNVDFLDTAKDNYDAAQQATTDGRLNEAIKFYEHVRNKFPYSKYAVLAELRTADAQFLREKWLEAADAYRLFVRFHPRSEEVPYALFRVCEAHSNAIEKSSIPFMNPVEKDQTPARDAQRSCDDFIARFPAEPKVAEATVKRTEARARLADTELLVAEFYAERGRYQGAVWRLLSVVEQYGDTPQAPTALARAAALTQSHLTGQASAPLWQRLVDRYPDSAAAIEARQQLTQAVP
jgi:outer membrane protein assembly factor BamD